MRRKEETLRRQEKQTHSEAAEEERSEGRNEPLSDWNAIVAGDVSVFPRPGNACARLVLSQVPLRSGDVPLSEEGLSEDCCLRLHARLAIKQLQTCPKPHLHDKCLILVTCVQKLDKFLFDSSAIYHLNCLNDYIKQGCGCFVKCLTNTH